MINFDNIQLMIKKHDIIGLRDAFAAGADPNLHNKHGWTPLMLAAIEGDIALCDIILKVGGDPNYTNEFGENAVALAALKGHGRILRYLLEKGGSMEIRPHGRDLREYIAMGGLVSSVEDEILSILGLSGKNDRS